MNNNKTPLKILLCIFILLLVSLIIYVYINKNNVKEIIDDEDVTQNDVSNDQNKELFKTDGSESLFTINGINEVKENDMAYTKINLNMNNNTNSDAEMDQYLFQITDENKEILSICYTGTNGQLTFDDIFPIIVDANSNTSGYLYCPHENKDIKYLKMTYILDRYETNNIDEVKTKEYYFEIK